ncbi:hypothetical protein ACSW9V_15145 (plasmid) [Clostridium perfringens]|uniref:hypothetical protein n=1 Tax=Clostridium perfringens TaxID=1502 RepID=UPI000B368581|nr:hypothetical protein [Clostridium perfringens]EGT0690798.1 hypothetical protein [Clostridium perfringens]EGT0693577.1 hypothetical protein [Clostridium perfringens]EGT0696534.1 hypothetical protein [Clostridium perfringens]MDU3376218.1 hypothetical protein [Clostridium perfringens]MDU3534174.1 hypothetical protein [Clostridium perfringens]
MKNLEELLNKFNEEVNLEGKNAICKQILKEGLVSEKELNKILVGFCKEFSHESEKYSIEFYCLKNKRVQTRVLNLYTLDDKVIKYNPIKVDSDYIPMFTVNSKLGGTTYLLAKTLKFLFQYTSDVNDLLHSLVEFRNMLKLDDYSLNSILESFIFHYSGETYSPYIEDNELKVKDYDNDVTQSFSTVCSIHFPSTVDLVAAIEEQICIECNDEENLNAM